MPAADRLSNLIRNNKLDFLHNTPCDNMKQLMADDGALLRGQYLGACLDKTRWGGTDTCLWPVSLQKIVGFISKWIEINKNRVPELIYGDSFDSFFPGIALPYISHDACPRDKEHNRISEYEDGTVRCINMLPVKSLKPGFIKGYSVFDSLAEYRRTECFENAPAENLPDDAYKMGFDAFFKDNPEQKEDYLDYLVLKEKFENEKPVDFTEVCFAIISEQNTILPLEEVLRRKNLAPETRRIDCPGYKCTAERIAKMTKEEKNEYTGLCCGHDEPLDEFIAGMDGWGLAAYVQKWWQQLPDGKTPLFGKGRVSKSRI